MFAILVVPRCYLRRGRHPCRLPDHSHQWSILVFLNNDPPLLALLPDSYLTFVLTVGFLVVAGPSWAVASPPSRRIELSIDGTIVRKSSLSVGVAKPPPVRQPCFLCSNVEVSTF